MQSAWIVPDGRESALYRLADAEKGGAASMARVASVAMPAQAIHAFDFSNDLLVYAEGHSIKILRGLSSGAPKESIVKLPRRHKTRAIALRQDAIYVGGAGGKDMLGLISLREGASFAPLQIPDKHSGWGKAVDGIALWGNRLVAVDDLVFPRFLLVYDVSLPHAPRFVQARPFPWHLSYEEVIAVAHDGVWMAVLSNYMNHGYNGSQIALVNLETLKEHAALYVQRPGSFRQVDKRSMNISTLGMAGSTLFIAAKDDGLGAVDIAPWVAKGPRLITVEVFSGGKSSTEEREAPVELPIDEVRFQRCPDGAVQGVIPASSQSAFAIVDRGVIRKDLRAVLQSF